MDEVDPDHVRGDEGDEGVEDDGDQDDEIQMKVYTVGEALENTKRSIDARKGGGGGGGGGKSAPRVWEPQGEYELFRSGIPLLSDPDECISGLQERTLTLFKHTDPSVKFAEEPKRPLWKGVFTMGAGMGYEEGQYYDPKQTHLTQIYATEWPKKNKPADNMRERRDGGKTPYWIDAWQIMKNNEESHRRKNRRRKASDMAHKPSAAAADEDDVADERLPLLPKQQVKGGKGRKAAAAPGGGGEDGDGIVDEKAPIVPPCEGFIFPVSGWMRDHISKRETAGPTVVANSMLRTSPATALIKKMPLFVAQLAKGEATVAPPATASAAPPVARPKQTPVAAPAGAAKKPVVAQKVAPSPQPQPSDQEEEEYVESLPAVAAAAPVAPTKKRERETVEAVAVVSKEVFRAPDEGPLATLSPVARDVLRTFATNRLQNAGKESAEGSFCAAWFECQPPDSDPDDFYRPGAPGDCIPYLAADIASKIMARMGLPQKRTKI